MSKVDYESVRQECLERVRFAGERVSELHVQIRDWRRTYPGELTNVVDADEQGWKIILTIKSQPPLVRWGLAVVEVLNHLRSALNNTLSLLVAADGLILVKPQQLQYPFAPTYDKWKNVSSWISELPEPVQRLIFCSQPFYTKTSFGRSGGEDFLTPLFRFDNQGKHGIVMAVEPGASEFQNQAHAVLRDRPATRPEFARSIHKPMWRDGAVFMEERTAPHRILRVWGEYDWFMKFVIRSATGEEFEIENHLLAVHDDVAFLINMLVDVWAGNVDASNLPQAGSADYGDFARPIQESAFMRPRSKSDFDEWPQLPRLWAPRANLEESK